MGMVTGGGGHAIDLILPATRRAPGEARTALRALEPLLPTETLDTALLLASELVTNSVRHGCTGPASRLRFRAEVDRNRIRIEVSDWGRGFDLGRLRGSPPDARGGFGLYLVDRLAARWGIANPGTMRVWFELELNSRAGAPPEPAA